MFTKVKLKKYIFGVGIFVFLVFIGLFLVIPKNDPNEALPTNKPTTIVGEIPKEVQEQIRNFGEPVYGEYSASLSGALEYKSDSETRNHSVEYQFGKPTFVKQIVTKNSVTIESLEKKYGKPEITLYGEYSDSGFNLYGYPSKGFAYLGSILAKSVLEVWYFAPTNIQTFKEIWAQDYSESQNPAF